MNTTRSVWAQSWVGRRCRPVDGLVGLVMLAAIIAAAVPARGDSGAARRAAVLSTLASISRVMNDYLLSVSVSGPGMGTVTDGAGFIDCGFDCTEFYFEGDEVTLTATAAPGNYFAGWNLGPCAGESGECSFMIPDDSVFVGAVFELNPRLEVQVFGLGSGRVESDIAGDSGFTIFCTNGSSPCDDTFPRGTTVVLTPTADPGFFFIGWTSGPCAGETGPCTVVLPDQTGTLTVTAEFGENPELDITVSGSGLGTVTTDIAGDLGVTLSCDSFGFGCTDTFPPGTTVVLTPTAQSGSHFFGWTSGPCAGLDGPCTITLPDGEGFVFVEARFDRNPEIEVRISGTGSGSVSSDIPADSGSPLDCDDVTEPCFESFPPDTIITFTAVAGANSFFEGWVQGPCGAQNPCEVLLMPTPMTIVLEASFRGNSPPTAVCQPVVIDATSECIALDVPASAFDGGSTDPDTDLGDVLMFSVSPTGPYPIGITAVTLTVTDVHGATDTCDTTIEVIAIDCNFNGVPDTCDIESGSSLDCNDNWVPDECECFWCNGIEQIAKLFATEDGQVSHEGGGAPNGAKVADDFYLEPGCVHRISAFRGKLLNNSLPQLRRARLEFYEDCNGKPADEPFATFLSTEHATIINVQASAEPGFFLLTYRFDLCDECLILDGGKAYWVSLIGISDNINQDLSFWLAHEDYVDMLGSVPVKAEGTRISWTEYDYGDWMSADECCLGCVNMDFCIDGFSCPIIWDNGKPDLGPGRGGSPSGGHQAYDQRTADSMVVKTCEDAPLCLIEAWIWSNCEPLHPFIEVYRDLPCGPPELELLPFRIYTGDEIDATKLDETWVFDNKTLNLWHLVVKDPDLTLLAGTNYWFSAGAYSTGNFASQSYFANAAPGCDPCTTPHTFKITPGQVRSLRPPATEWAPVVPARDFAFRISRTNPLALNGDDIDPDGPDEEGPFGTPDCIADSNTDGNITVDDIFFFLSAWFNGCP